MNYSIKTALICTSVLIAIAIPVQANRGKALEAVVKMLVGSAAAGAIANGVEAESIQEQKMSVVDRIRQQGVDPRVGAIFSTYFTLNNNADAVYWADVFSKPDVYIIVAIEGQGEYLIPKYTSEYAGQPLMTNIIAKQIAPGRKVAVYILDEDTTSDTVWNNLLKTRVSFNAAADVEVYKPIDVTLSASGTVQLVDRYVTLDAPEFIAYAEFIAPDTDESVWAADGILKDQYNRNVGKIQFSQIWKADPDVIDAAESELIRSGKSKVFWFGLSAVLVLVFGKMLFFSNSKAA